LRGVLVFDADYKKVRITLVQAGKAKHPIVTPGEFNGLDSRGEPPKHHFLRGI
jgi:hypothetical protein